MQRSALATAGGLALWLLLTFIAAAIGGFASVDAKTFYAALDKPAWAPPGAVFGPAWTALYLLMAIAAWLVWRHGGRAARPALVLYVVQLVLNALWSWLFFAWHRGALAMIEIVLLWIAITATALAFYRVRPLAAVLLLPYLGWVSFAAALTFAVWRANPGLL